MLILLHKNANYLVFCQKCIMIFAYGKTGNVRAMRMNRGEEAGVLVGSLILAFGAVVLFAPHLLSPAMGAGAGIDPTLAATGGGGAAAAGTGGAMSTMQAKALGIAIDPAVHLV